jgi:hypothetical protein
VVGGIYNPNHQKNRWWRLLSYGAPDSPVHHRTLSGAPATSPGHWVLTVGASDRWATGQSGGAPDSYYSLSGAPSGTVLTSARTGAHCSLLLFRCRRPLALCSRYSPGTPDSPVNYSRAAPRIPEGDKFKVGFPGAPDTVQWCTGHCLVAHWTVRCARPGHTSVVFCSFYLNHFLVFLLVCCEPLAPVELII